MQEVPLFPWWLTLALAAWGAIGPFVGIFVGSYLTRSAQRRQWLADNRLQEWRELISTLLGSVEIIAKMGAKGVTKTIEMRTEGHAAEMAALQAIGTRIFINADVQEEDLHKKWSALVEEFQSTQDLEKFGTGFGGILKSLRRKASHDIGSI